MGRPAKSRRDKFEATYAKIKGLPSEGDLENEYLPKFIEALKAKGYPTDRIVRTIGSYGLGISATRVRRAVRDYDDAGPAAEAPPAAPPPPSPAGSGQGGPGRGGSLFGNRA